MSWKTKKEERRKDKIKFKDRDSVKWIKEKAPDLIGNSLEFIGDITGIEALEKLGERIAGNNHTMKPEDQAYALQLINQEIEAEREITKRWVADMTSDNYLSKIARPIVLLYSWLLMTVVVILSFCGLTLPDPIVYMVSSMLGIVTAGYFGLRTVEKRNFKKYRNEKE